MWEPGQPWEIGPHSRQLLLLASGPWAVPDIRLACAMNGWQVRLQSWGPLTFELDARMALRCFFGEDRWPPHGQVLLYYHSEGNYWRDEEFRDFGQADFDRAYQVAFDRLVDSLGHPEVAGSHSQGWLRDDLRYHFGIWRGERGLLILQQGELDLQSGGVDLSVVLHPWEHEARTPTMPLLVNYF